MRGSDLRTIADDLKEVNTSLGSNRVYRLARGFLRASDISSDIQAYEKRLNDAVQRFQVSARRYPGLCTQRLHASTLAGRIAHQSSRANQQDRNWRPRACT